jgi:GntR family transcriptional regulator, rspAB operon transcriptional repressor
MPLEHVDLSDQVVHRSLADLARARVLQDILQRRLEPGALIQLKSLADAYGMSRTPVREALTQLQQSGLVVAIPYKGYRISPIDRGDIEDVIFMRHLLEPIAAERAATNITADEIAELEALQPPDTDELDLEFDRYSEKFHTLIGVASGSKRLAQMIESVYRDVRRLQSAGLSRSVPRLIVSEHNAIIELLRSGDARGAREAMSHHVLTVHAKALDDLRTPGNEQSTD